jgi:diaminobutyrate-2-oxoglutarate transaminase
MDLIRRPRDDRAAQHVNVFETVESEVRRYCRSWPIVFERAVGSQLHDEDGRVYLDFFAGAGALNYGHNNPALKHALIEYLSADGITHGLDMSTVAKRRFLETFVELVLQPRNLDYKVQFPGPTGAHSVEAALMLARKVTGRSLVINFTNAFHGVTLGAASVSRSSVEANGSTIAPPHTRTIPYDDPFATEPPDLLSLERLLGDCGNGVGAPAAVIVETVQGEGGVNVARAGWLRGLAEMCTASGILLIVDDVQMGCGRTGPFLSFENAGIQPDIVCLSKAIGGYGLPMALTLIKPEFDVWQPGEHSGTFRGNNAAFVTATAALEIYWADDALERRTLANGEEIGRAFDRIAAAYPSLSLQTRGCGLARGLAFGDADTAGRVCDAAFERGLLIETAGRHGEVAKVMPPLTVTDEELQHGLRLLDDSVSTVRASRPASPGDQLLGSTARR